MTKKIKNYENLVRDVDSNAVINIDSKKLITAKISKKIRQDKIDRLNKLEDDIKDIKNLLNSLASIIKSK